MLGLISQSKDERSCRAEQAQTHLASSRGNEINNKGDATNITRPKISRISKKVNAIALYETRNFTHKIQGSTMDSSD